MCGTAHATAADASRSGPHAVRGAAVDPIALEPVDEVRVTILMDNTFDALLVGDARTTRTGFGATDVAAGQFEPGRTAVGLLAEHGFSALVAVRRGDSTTTLMFDAGLSPAGIVTNADRLGIGLGDLHGVVLSHGHFDHAGGLSGLSSTLGAQGMPMVVHPHAWTRRRLRGPQGTFDMPTLSKRALAAEGFEVVERSQPSLLVDGAVLITGEVDRTTEFEHGMPAAHEAWAGGEWRHDPQVIDDQALVVDLRNQGLIILTGCGHAGVVNIVRHAQRLTGVTRLHALLGGFHLGGPAFEPVIAPTVAALVDCAPRLVAPGHCTGWRAQHALAAALPDAWVPSSSGTTHRLVGA
ncbi:MBL fold metallo-hydrolase [Actinacidiphila rubida]|uniref:7,8-dihydropterin-6-yl-methyl-4-(Beta-D-ribofuranosyl)aminobenzene 5'-phosphate synthase n=1 Tax=Actinacidiphila rubida TaxID=310780 RepID=A0A1H8K924_9ACTN|nr:MBL fold metallo-hydrolase [Actinacidiphila rubida]SEN89490.1 7,8-dihydropterin-6-yl-methyl-4-(beta-D-ribofuranosyl)aminobenzene 5'-phosphate synthase [Actinacidiphila rubida]